MADENGENSLSLRELQYWLRMEQETLRIAMEERLKEAKAIVDGYAAGHLTEEQAEAKMSEYNSRWPDAAKDTATQERIDDAVQDAIEGPPSRPWAEIHEEQDRRHAETVRQIRETSARER